MVDLATINHYRNMELNGRQTGARLKQLMKEAHVTTQDMADLCGVSRVAVSKWLSGKSEPELFRLYIIADYLQVDIEDFLVVSRCRHQKTEGPAARKVA